MLKRKLTSDQEKIIQNIKMAGATVLDSFVVPLSEVEWVDKKRLLLAKAKLENGFLELIKCISE